MPKKRVEVISSNMGFRCKQGRIMLSYLSKIYPAYTELCISRILFYVEFPFKKVYSNFVEEIFFSSHVSIVIFVKLIFYK